MTNLLVLNPREYVKSWAVGRTHLHFNSLWLDYLKDLTAYRDVAGRGGYARADLKDAYDEFMYGAPARTRAEIAAHLSYRPDPDNNLEKFVTALTGSAPHVRCTIVRQWIWMAKRNLLDLPDEYQIMLVLRGGQGKGKTTAVDKLVAPLGSLVARYNMKHLTTDPRIKPSLEHNIVGVFDELSGAKDAAKDQLRTLITQREDDYRPLYGNVMLKMRNRCSFIGSSNPHLVDLLGDAHGMRRFFELICDALNQDLINQIDFVALWRGVDETRSTAWTRDILTEVAAEQESLMPHDVFQEFCSEYVLRPGEGVIVTTKEVYQYWRDFCDARGEKPGAQSHMTALFKQSGFDWSRGFRIPGIVGQVSILKFSSEALVGKPVVVAMRSKG
jgi:hypothetical protein